MEMKRRDFLKFSLAQAVVMSAAQNLHAQTPMMAHTGPSILQGATDATKTQFSIVFDSHNDFQVFVSNSKGQRWLPDEVRPITFPNHEKKITKVFFSNLTPKENYTLNLIDPTTQQLIDSRFFQTLDLTKESARFAVCSCMKESHHDPAIWRDLVSKQPDMIFFIGDCVYADSHAPGPSGADPAHLWRRFCEARTTLEIYYSKTLIPIIATWDDHDFGLNDSNRHNYPYYRESQKNFLQFFAQEPSHCELLFRGPGVSSALKFANQLFLLLDDRSYRENSGSRDRHAHWGKEQELWMMDLISKNSGPSWIFNGTQIFPNMFFKESVSGDHPEQLAGLLKDLKQHPSRVIFVSGDVHFSEISEIELNALGYRTYEVTSSSVHSLGIPGVPEIIPNPRRIASTAQRNYVLIEATANGYGCLFTTTSYDRNGGVNFNMELEV